MTNRRAMLRRESVSQLNKLLPMPIQLDDRAPSAEYFLEHSHITDVLVGDYHVIEGEGGAAYVVWALRVIVNGAMHSSIVVYKRYSDIERLRGELIKHHRDVEIPPLPAKDRFSILRWVKSPNWLEERRKGLQWFMTNVFLNPKLQHSPVISDFILK